MNNIGLHPVIVQAHQLHQLCQTHVAGDVVAQHVAGDVAAQHMAEDMEDVVEDMELLMVHQHLTPTVFFHQ